MLRRGLFLTVALVVIGVGLTAVAQSREQAKPRASAAAKPWCSFRVGAPYYAAGYAQADASHECYVPIKRHDIYANLLKWYNGKWNLMAKRQAGYSGKRQIAVHPTYACTATVTRIWKMDVTVLMTDASGMHWADYSGPQKTLNCG
jgi:hypothetical protein